MIRLRSEQDIIKNWKGDVSKPLVSISCIAYNHENFIEATLKGFLIQETDFSFEILIHDDASLDKTADIIRAYEAKYPNLIKPICQTENQYSKKDDTIWRIQTDRAKGKYFAFCEGDDYWTDSYKLQKQVDYLETHPDCGLVHGDVDRYDVATGERLPNFHRQRRPLYKHIKILNGMIVNEYIVETCTAVIRKEMHDEIRRSCVYEFGGKFLMRDVQTWIEIAHRSKVKYIDESLAVRNLLPESGCLSRDLTKCIKFSKSARDIALHYADKYGGKDSVKLKKYIVGHFTKVLLSLAYRSSSRNLAKESLKMARSYQVALDPMSYLDFIGCQNIMAFYIVNLVRLGVRICAKIIRIGKIVTNHLQLTKAAQS